METLDAKRLAASLEHVPFVRRIVVLGTTESTNDDARRLAGEGAPEGTVVLAERQTAGRGRLGRPWASPAGLGLYLSVLLRPDEPMERIGRYPIATAVAACAACSALVSGRVVVKWPNDVLAGGAKLAGVLSEMRQGTSGSELVLGIGVNVNHAREDFPEALRETATSLRIVGGAVLDREIVTAALLEELAGAIAQVRADGWAEVADRFLRYAPDATGRRVRLAAGGSGLTDGLDASGALRVVTATGIVLVHASESVAIEG